MDARARGAFVGLTLKHTSAHLARAIMEGVALGLRQIIEVMDALDAPLQSAVVSGGGLANPIWRQILADVTGRTLYLAQGSEKAALGAALMGAIAVKWYGSYKEACSALPAPTLVTEPIALNVQLYKRHYEQFISLYPLLKANFHASA
jgi:xylulokinase